MCFLWIAKWRLLAMLRLWFFSAHRWIKYFNAFFIVFVTPNFNFRSETNFYDKNTFWGKKIVLLKKFLKSPKCWPVGVFQLKLVPGVKSYCTNFGFKIFAIVSDRNPTFFVFWFGFGSIEMLKGSVLIFYEIWPHICNQRKKMTLGIALHHITYYIHINYWERDFFL